MQEPQPRNIQPDQAKAAEAQLAPELVAAQLFLKAYLAVNENKFPSPNILSYQNGAYLQLSPEAQDVVKKLIAENYEKKKEEFKRKQQEEIERQKGSAVADAQSFIDSFNQTFRPLILTIHHFRMNADGNWHPQGLAQNEQYNRLSPFAKTALIALLQAQTSN